MIELALIVLFFGTIALLIRANEQLKDTDEPVIVMGSRIYKLKRRR